MVDKVKTVSKAELRALQKSGTLKVNKKPGPPPAASKDDVSVIAKKVVEQMEAASAQRHTQMLAAIQSLEVAIRAADSGLDMSQLASVLMSIADTPVVERFKLVRRQDSLVEDIVPVYETRAIN